MCRPEFLRFRLALGLLVWSLAVPTASAQWFAPKARGALLGRGGHVAKPPGLPAPQGGAVTAPHALAVPPAGISPTAPPWHHFRQDPFLEAARQARERYEYDVDRMLRYRTREERYADDFRDRYSTGDPFYHQPPTHYPAPEVIDPAAWGLTAIHKPPVPGVAHSPANPAKRGHLTDAELPDQLRAAANRLATSLSRMRDGDLWLEELQPLRIVNSIDRGEHPLSLEYLVAVYSGVAENPRLVLIARATGFQETNRWLARYVQLPSRYPLEEGSWESPPSPAPPTKPLANPNGSLGQQFQDLDQGPHLDEPWSAETRRPIDPTPPPRLNPPPAPPLPEVQLLPTPPGEPDR